MIIKSQLSKVKCDWMMMMCMYVLINCYDGSMVSICCFFTACISLFVHGTKLHLAEFGYDGLDLGFVAQANRSV